jgi:hypothetical protein
VEVGALREALRVDLGHPEDEIALVVAHQVPGVGGELVPHPVDEPRRPEEVDCLLPAEGHPQQGVEPREVVHVGVGDEGVGDLEELPRREGREVAQIEEQRPPLEEEVDVEPRIAKRVVDEPGVEERFHA